MICQICKENTATIHLTEIVDGKRHEKHLCETCAHSENIAFKTQIPLNELLSNLLAVQPQELINAEPQEEISCPECDITMSQINDQSILGCPEDYEIFNDSMEKIIEKTQDGSTVHCGKIPQRAQEEVKTESQLEQLKNELEEAVRDERYEQAAELRDKILLLECK